MKTMRTPLLFLMFGLALAAKTSRADSQLSLLRDRIAHIKPYDQFDLRPLLPIPVRDHQMVFELPLVSSSCKFSTEHPTTAVLLVGPWDSILLVFDGKGSLKYSRGLPYPDTVQTLDLDSDGREEILLDQVDGRGTGILLKEFHLYSVRDETLGELWSGLSFERLVNTLAETGPQKTLAFGLVKLEAARAGNPARLFHFIERHKGDGKEPAVERRVYTLKPGANKLEEIPWPGESTTYSE